MKWTSMTGRIAQGFVYLELENETHEIPENSTTHSKNQFLNLTFEIDRQLTWCKDCWLGRDTWHQRRNLFQFGWWAVPHLGNEVGDPTKLYSSLCKGSHRWRLSNATVNNRNLGSDETRNCGLIPTWSSSKPKGRKATFSSANAYR